MCYPSASVSKTCRISSSVLRRYASFLVAFPFVFLFLVFTMFSFVIGYQWGDQGCASECVVSLFFLFILLKDPPCTLGEVQQEMSPSLCSAG